MTLIMLSLSIVPEGMCTIWVRLLTVTCKPVFSRLWFTNCFEYYIEKKHTIVHCFMSQCCLKADFQKEQCCLFRKTQWIPWGQMVKSISFSAKVWNMWRLISTPPWPGTYMLGCLYFAFLTFHLKGNWSVKCRIDVCMHFHDKGKGICKTLWGRRFFFFLRICVLCIFVGPDDLRVGSGHI
jgi:hypothetical protein